MAVEQTASVSQMSACDQMVQFCLDNNIQRPVIDELLERGFDSVQALSLVDAEDLKTQKIPVGQRRLIIHIAKSIGKPALENASTPTPGTSADPSTEAAPQEGPTQQPDVYQRTLLSSLLSQQAQLAATPHPNVQSQQSCQNVGTLPIAEAGLSQPSWQDPQVHIANATDSLAGCPSSPTRQGQSSGTQQEQQTSTLSSNLDEEVCRYRSSSFASSTARTYSAHLATYLEFCSKLSISPVPISQMDLGRYIAYISRRLSFSSVRQYLNIVRLLHLEAGFKNPLDNNWYASSILKGVKRIKGSCVKQKLPITLGILKGIFLKLKLQESFDRTFWAACLVGFYSFFRKSNLLIESHMLFDPVRHLCATDVHFAEDGAVLTVRWSKVIQFRQRVLQIPLPKMAGSPFCPSTALLHLLVDNPVLSFPVPLFRFTQAGAQHIPLTHKLFKQKLHSCLTLLGINPADYSGHSFRRGGATFALQCGLPTDLIKLQGDWSSNAYERYLEPSFCLRKQVAVTMGKSTSASLRAPSSTTYDSIS